MPRKCSVYGCRSGYDKRNKDDETEKVTVHGFPSNVEECRKWITSLPNANITVETITKHIVCAKHWPSDVPMQLRGTFPQISWLQLLHHST